jgi:hypothetical protein
MTLQMSQGWRTGTDQLMPFRLNYEVRHGLGISHPMDQALKADHGPRSSSDPWSRRA